MDYTPEVLRLLAINEEHFAEDFVTGVGSAKLDPKTLALVRLGALVAVGGAVPSYGKEADAAVSAGATAAEIVGAAGRRLRRRGSPVLSRRLRVWRWRWGTTSTIPQSDLSERPWATQRSRARFHAISMMRWLGCPGWISPGSVRRIAPAAHVSSVPAGGRSGPSPVGLPRMEG